MNEGKPYTNLRKNAKHSISQSRSPLTRIPTVNDGKRYPVSVLVFDSQFGFHPTQKPVALFEYLIRTYTNEGETILDNTMGSGTTGVACINTGRNFIGIEKDPEYFRVASERIAAAMPPLPRFTFRHGPPPPIKK